MEWNVSFLQRHQTRQVLEIYVQHRMTHDVEEQVFFIAKNCTLQEDAFTFQDHDNEMPVHSDMPCNYTINGVGEKSDAINIRLEIMQSDHNAEKVGRWHHLTTH
jgi:hypothetical protein